MSKIPTIKPSGLGNWRRGQGWDRLNTILAQVSQWLGLGSKVDPEILLKWYEEWKKEPQNKDKDASQFQDWVMRQGTTMESPYGPFYSKDQNAWSQFRTRSDVGSDIAKAGK